MANSFLHGKLYFLEKPGNWYDSTMHLGKVYWPLGLSPILILVPFVGLFNLFGQMFYQGYLQIIMTAGTFYMAYRIAKQHKYTHEDSLWLAFAFCFASVYIIIALIPWGWYFAQAIVVFFTFLAISEWYGRKRYWLIGIYYAIIVASRFTGAIGLLFFAADLLIRKKKLQRKELVSHLLALFIPVMISGLCLLWYNYARFGNPLDNGYMGINNWTIPIERRFETINYGLFQLRNVPMNIYYYFIKTVDPVLVNHFGDFGQTFILKPPYIKLSYPGTSFFVSAPIFLYVFSAIRKKIKTREVWLALIPTVTTLSILMFYYWPGWRQVGPRYTADFLPFTYIVLLFAFRKSSLGLFPKLLITASAILDFYLFFYAVKIPV